VELCMTLKMCSSTTEFGQIAGRNHQTNIGTPRCHYVVRNMQREVRQNGVAHKTSWVHEEVLRGCLEINVLSMNLYPPTGKGEAQPYVEDTNSLRHWVFHKSMVINSSPTTGVRLRSWKWEQIVRCPNDLNKGKTVRISRTKTLDLHAANMHQYQVVLLSVGSGGENAPALGPMIEKICEALSRAGLNVWYPPSRLVASLGKKHPDIDAVAFGALLSSAGTAKKSGVKADQDLLQLATAVTACELLVPLLTNDLVDSSLCRALLHAAKDAHKKILPIVCDAATPKRTDSDFRSIQSTLGSARWLHNTNEQHVIQSLKQTLLHRELDTDASKIRRSKMQRVKTVGSIHGVDNKRFFTNVLIESKHSVGNRKKVVPLCTLTANELVVQTNGIMT